MEVLTGVCPDSECKKQLFFPANLKTGIIACTNCGQRHECKHLLNVAPVSNPGHALQGLLQNILIHHIPEHVKKTSDFVKVKGLSNYGCKLISPLLTKYGLHKESQEVRLLCDMGQGDTFNCSHLADRAFLIEEQNLMIPGYGKDIAAAYLKDTLDEIGKVNNSDERLVPIHADGDGHCLLHAISRALVGHELFWHPLLTNLKLHFTLRQDDYKGLFKDFIELSEWKDIIAECDPNFVPSYGEAHGLRNIHILGLANVLHRPIVLIDSLEGMKSKGDYSALFLPGLVPFEECKNRYGELHKPIVISWSSKGRNHFIPLVGILGKELPKFPAYLLPKVWGLPQELMTKYIKFENNAFIIGGKNSLQERYLMKLAAAMEKHFLSLKGVSPSVVTDVYHHIFRPSGVVGISTQIVTETAHVMVIEERLYKCLLCQSVVEEKLPCPLNWLEPGGELYEIAKQTHGTLKDGYKYKFPVHNIVCSYKKDKNKLIHVQNIEDLQCQHCKGSLRLVHHDGTLVYFNGDQLSTPASSTSKCGCGYKHCWDGKEYDNLPEKIPIVLEWNNNTFNDFVYWFQNESEQCLNSNAFKTAQEVVQNYFPGEFGSERLVQNVVNQIFAFTTSNQPPKKDERTLSNAESDGIPSCVPMKIILTGEKSKTIHKEELTTSKSEQVLQKRIEHGAALKQKRLSSSPLRTPLPENEKYLNLENGINTSPTREKIKKADTLTRKIRIVCEDQGHKMFLLTDTTNFTDIQMFIKENFNVSLQQQIIKHGFPPKTLEEDLDEDGNQKPVNLKHGDRLIVHLKKVVVPIIKTVEITNSAVESTDKSEFPEVRKLANNLFSLFDNVDLWQWACTQRPMFQVNGLFYKMSFRDLGLLTEDQHLSLPCFPGKIFTYNEREDEVFLCLGKTHIFVQPLSEQQLKLANEQAMKKEIELHTKETETQKRATDSNGPISHGTSSITFKEGRSLSIGDDDIPTIRETIDFADFKMDNDFNKEERMDTTESMDLNGDSEKENET